MEQQKNRIAIISRSQDLYSETFIQAQKNGLQGKIFYYFGKPFPVALEGHGSLYAKKLYFRYKLNRLMGSSPFTIPEMALIRSFKKNKIQLVLAQYGTTAAAILKVCQHLKIPLITHFHGFDASVTAVIAKHGSYQDVFRYSSFVVAVSEAMYQQLLQLGCPEAKLVKNTYGPNQNFLEVKPQFSEDSFIGLGRFVDKKAPYYTILAFKKVHQKFPDAKLVIGGTGELYEVCKNLVRGLGLVDAVILPGVLDQQQFIGYLSKSLAFVQHSITASSGDQEGTPVAVLEASAAGLPVIATRHAGIPDVILDGQSGYIVAEHDVEGMASCMEKLLHDKILARDLGAHGKQRVLTHFTIRRYLDVLDHLIHQTIDSHE